MALRGARLGLLVAALGVFGACGDAGEGESCDLANGNDDCEQGLVCRGSWEVASKSSVCCPAPPAESSVGACQPKVTSYEPDPSVDAAAIPPGSGGSAGSGGAAGSGGSAGADGSAGSGGSAGADGAAGAAGSDGAAGADAADAAQDSTQD